LIRLRDALIDRVSRIHARVQTKLLVAFLAMVVLLVLLGGMGLRVLGGMSQQVEELIELQRKIAAFRQVQHNTTSQLYGVSTGLLAPDERTLDGLLRQLSQFGYDLDRLSHVAQDEVDILGRVRDDYDRFIEVVGEAVSLARAGHIEAAREVQLTLAGPLAERLERLTNQLVNVAEADMLERITLSEVTYARWRTGVIATALGSVVLALGLGYLFSWSLVRPITAIEDRLGKIAAGDFSEKVAVASRDELGSLASNVNRMSEELDRLYRHIAERRLELERSVRELEALGEVSQAVNSTLELEVVLETIASHAMALAAADAAIFWSWDEAAGVFHMQASRNLTPSMAETLASRAIGLGDGAVGQAGQQRQAVEIPDIDAEPDYSFAEIVRPAGYRAVLALPLLREAVLFGGIVLVRRTPGGFAPEAVALVQTLANQSVLAIQNAMLFQELAEKSRQVEEASRHKSEFLANMSHELRTPLNAILGFTELIQDGIYGEVSEKVQQQLERVRANGQHLLGLINDVLDLSKIEAGQLELQTAPFALADVVRSVESTVGSLALAKQLDLRIELPASLPIVEGDARRIAQVLLNLVGNAIKFTEAGAVTISAHETDGAVEVSVRDTGPGIPPAEQARIFDAFHQVDSSSTKKQGGTGLGLAIARQIIELHGGQIGVASQPGEGSRFFFAVPLPARGRHAA
jgi:signal transduction histidine kinase/methyl-accepting chemotaxis protein